MTPETIKVTVLFFGAAAELTRKRDEEITLPAGTSAQNAKTDILAAHPLLGERYGNNLLFSVNREYARGDEILATGDELAFFPPVSGG